MILKIKLYYLVLFFLVNISFSNVIFSQTPNTFTINGEKLKESKYRVLIGYSLYIKAKQELIRDAGKALKNGPYSVAFKNTLPPSGTKSDYFSLSRYWWPDHSKSDGLPYIRKDGRVNPERENIPDYKMMNNMATDVFTLGLAFYFTQEEKYAKHAKYLIKVFFFDRKTKMNPNFEYSQVVLGKPESGGATISATALIPFIEGVQLLKESKNWTRKDREELESWFSEFLDWMLNSEKGKKQALATNNIGTYYTVQTATYALFIGCRNLAKEILVSQGPKRISGQIDENGAMKLELKRAAPWEYVKYNLSAFDKLVEVGKKVNVDLLEYESEAGGSIVKAFNWLVPYAQGEMKWSYSNERVSSTAVKTVLERVKSLNFNLRKEKISNYRVILY